MLSKYSISKGCIGIGSYGSVFSCIEKSTGRSLAIKRIVMKNYKTHGTDFRVLRETTILKSCKHHNIINLLDVFFQDDSIFLVMEKYIDLYTFMAKYSNCKLPENLIRKTMKQLLNGVQYLHSNNIIHRDIKLDNILLTEDFQLKIADFGLSRKINNKIILDEEFVATGFLGTMNYMAPEVIRQVPYNHKVDIFSIGIIFTELLIGHSMPEFSKTIDQLQYLYDLFDNNSLKFNDTFKSLSAVEKDFLKKMCELDPLLRWDASDLLNHKYFNSKM